MVVVNVSSMIWGDQTRVLRTSLELTWSVFNVLLTQSQAFTLVIGAATFLIYFVLLKYTDVGVKFRAIATNRDEAELRGINVTRYRMAAFALSGPLAGVAGLVAALDRGFRPQEGGLEALTLAVVAFIIGGRRSLWSALVGGLFVGMIRSWAQYFTSSQWQNAVSFALLILFVLIRPDGLLEDSSAGEAGQ